MKFFPVLLAIIIFASCKNKGSQPPATSTGVDTTQRAQDTASFLPISSLLREDLLRVDSFGGGILKKTTLNGKKDSLFIKLPAFKQAASVFFMPELETSAFRQSFTETSLLDATTEMVQFMYAPKDASNTLRNVVVYINPVNSQVNRFYFEKEWAAGDTIVQQKLTWKARQYFYIITLRQPKQGTPTTSIEKLIWAPEYYGE
ncbi:MAG: hypothetical protein J7621_09995 [Niastella sp.]|nr:hypothetical protein [Niastella sp.]